MASVLGFITRNYTTFFPPKVTKDAHALRIGILGAANIAPIALCNPSYSHSEVVLQGVAARDVKRAEAFAKKWSVNRVYSSYQELVESPDIDAVYNPLPNGLHYEWTMKALKAGKHVLLEKPSGNNAEETKKMFDFAKSKNLVLLEAFHYRFHPFIQQFKALLESDVIGKVKGIDVQMAVPSGFVKPTDIRFNYELGGGALMDMGCYAISVFRYLLKAEPQEILRINVNKADAQKNPLVDRSTRAVFWLPDQVSAAIYCDFAMPRRLWVGKYFPQLPLIDIHVFGEEGELYGYNFAAPSAYHYITLKKNGKVETIKAYTGEKISGSMKGEAWWTTYRYMLEAFVDKVKGRTPQTWMSAEDSIANMEVIDSVYESAGLGKRPTSEYFAQS